MGVVFLYNIVQAYVDSKKILHTYQRTVYTQVKSIGRWYEIIHVIGMVSVLTNTGILTVTTNDYAERYSLDAYTTLWYALIVEHVALLLRLLILQAFNDMPSRVVKLMALDDFESKLY